MSSALLLLLLALALLALLALLPLPPAPWLWPASPRAWPWLRMW